MGNGVFIGLLEAAAISSCLWGMYHVYMDSTSIVGIVYNGLWFILGLVSNAMGLLSIMYYYLEDDELMPDAHWLLQHHYLFAWFTVIIGYPTFVASIWMSHYCGHYSVYWSHGHVGLALIPILAWITQRESIIMVSTQVTTVLGILSQAYICYLAKSVYGLVGAGLMLINLISLSVPTRYSFLEISARETFIIGLGVCSFLFAKTVEHMAFKHVTPPMTNFILTYWEYITRMN